MLTIKNLFNALREQVLHSYKTLFVVLCVSFLIALICRNPFQGSGLSYSVGDIARKNITAPKNIRIADEELTEKRRSAAADLVLNIYDYDPQAKMLMIERLSKSFDLI